VLRATYRSDIVASDTGSLATSPSTQPQGQESGLPLLAQSSRQHAVSRKWSRRPHPIRRAVAQAAEAAARVAALVPGETSREVAKSWAVAPRKRDRCDAARPSAAARKRRKPVYPTADLGGRRFPRPGRGNPAGRRPRPCRARLLPRSAIALDCAFAGRYGNPIRRARYSNSEDDPLGYKRPPDQSVSREEPSLKRFNAVVAAA
jgi:hypothetical protein